MRFRRPLHLSAVILALAAAPCIAQPAPPSQPQVAASFTIKTAVPFAKGLSGDLLSDLYLPAGPGPFPAILYIHGGGWQNGTRDQLAPIAKALAAHHYAGMAIDYDVSDNGAKFPTALYESKQALRWLKSHAAEYHLDPNRIAVLGSSAGGELAALMGLTVNNPDYDGNIAATGPAPTAPPPNPSALQAVVVYNGVLDLTTQPDDNVSVNKYLGGPCSKLPIPCKDASPQLHIHPGVPPFYIGHGTADESVPFAQATAFEAALTAAKIPNQTFVAEKGPHTYWSKPAWFQPNVDQTLQFLNHYLAPSTHN